MKVFLATYGCRANQADTEALRAVLHASGVEIASAPDEADAAVFNSCAVTTAAEADLRQGVRRAARGNPALRTVVMGCAAALDRGAIAALPTVRRVVAGADLASVATALELDSSAVGRALAGAGAQGGARALLRIQDGCDAHCTFCATRLARGASRSRPIAALADEAAQLAAHHPEIVLTGVHIGAYGADIGSSLGELLERLVTSVPVVRFRLTSVEATEVDDRLRELLASDARRVAPWLHAPLQSGSDRVLRRMGRHWYTAASYAAAVERVVGGRDVFGLGADVIAGFPGETEDEHRATVALVERMPITALHVFPYSERPGTAAARLAGRVAPAVVARRARELREAGARKADAHRARRAGGAADVVIVTGGARREGLTEDHLAVVPEDPTLPRRARIEARLELRDGRLFARTAQQ